MQEEEGATGRSNSHQGRKEWGCVKDRNKYPDKRAGGVRGVSSDDISKDNEAAISLDGGQQRRQEGGRWGQG